jgi:hypothetical protein
VATGDPELCRNCSAIFSVKSKKGKDFWICDFCGIKNKLDLEPEEMPKGETVDYLKTGM